MAVRGVEPGNDLISNLDGFVAIYEDAALIYELLSEEDKAEIARSSPDLHAGIREGVMDGIVRLHPEVREAIAATFVQARQTALDAQSECRRQLAELRVELARAQEEITVHRWVCPGTIVVAEPPLP